MSNIIYPKTKIYTDGNITGSGTVSNPLDLNDNIAVDTITASNIIITETASINILNTIEANSLKIGDKYITIMSGANTQAELNDAGILFGSNSVGEIGEQKSVAHIIYKDSGDQVEIYPNLKVSGSAQIIGNLTASNISGTLIGPAGGILSGSYPNPSGLKGPIIQISGSTTITTSTPTSNLTIYPSGSVSLKSTEYISSEISNGYINTRALNGGYIRTSVGVLSTTAGEGIYLECSNKDNSTNYNGNIYIGGFSTKLSNIEIGTSNMGESYPKITIGKPESQIILNGPETRKSLLTAVVPNSSIKVTSPTIQLAPTSSLTMSAKPSVEFPNYAGNIVFPSRNFPNGVRVSLINTTDYDICLLNDTSTTPTLENGSVPSSSLKLGASQRVIKKWGILELQYQASGSSNAGYWVETNFSNNLTGCVDLAPYALLSGSVITASSLRTDYIDFNTSSFPNPPPPPAQLGRIFYNGSNGDLSTYLNTSGLMLNNGQQLIQKCQNKSGAPLPKGTVVHLSGSDGLSDTPRINVADWSNDGMSANTLGLTMESIANDATGYVIVQGILTGLTLPDLPVAAANGQVLYLSSNGRITNVKPQAPNHMVSIGQIIAKADTPNNKFVYVSIQNGYELSELHDVLISGVENGDLLVWDDTNNVWKDSKVLSGSYTIEKNLNIGVNNVNTLYSSLIVGDECIANSGNGGIAFGNRVNVSSIGSYGRGQDVISSGWFSSAEGSGSIANNTGSHAEGFYVVADQAYSHAEGYQTLAMGVGSHAEGNQTTASADMSHTEGNKTFISSTSHFSHAEGVETIIIDGAIGAHTEGYLTTASGDYCHAEGFNTYTDGYGCHVEGDNTKAYNICNHAEGGGTTAQGNYSHAEGMNNFAGGSGCHAEGRHTSGSGRWCHAEGSGSYADGTAAHSEGYYTIASGSYCHAEGVVCYAINSGSHAEGNYTTASGDYSHSEGFKAIASGHYSHAEGGECLASSSGSHAEGYQTTASNLYSHAEGTQTIAFGRFSHAEGRQTYAFGSGSHAEGYFATASGRYSHAEGYYTTASGDYSHVEGYYTTASGQTSHAEGVSTNAIGVGSHAEGIYTIAIRNHQHVQGEYNQTSSTALMIVGNGTGPEPENRSNILEVYDDNITVKGEIRLRSSDGIKFGTSYNLAVTSTTLDDYEEGTWTPSFSGSTSGGSLNYIFNSGSYIKVGKMITVNGRIDLGTTSSAPTGDLYVTGLPYASNNYFGASNIYWQGSCAYANMGNDPSGSITYWCQMDDAENILAIKRGYGQSVNSNVLVASQSDFSFSITYFTN